MLINTISERPCLGFGRRVRWKKLRKSPHQLSTSRGSIYVALDTNLQNGASAECFYSGRLENPLSSW